MGRYLLFKPRLSDYMEQKLSKKIQKKQFDVRTKVNVLCIQKSTKLRTTDRQEICRALIGE